MGRWRVTPSHFHDQFEDSLTVDVASSPLEDDRKEGNASAPTEATGGAAPLTSALTAVRLQRRESGCNIKQPPRRCIDPLLFRAWEASGEPDRAGMEGQVHAGDPAHGVTSSKQPWVLVWIFLPLFENKCAGAPGRSDQGGFLWDRRGSPLLQRGPNGLPTYRRASKLGSDWSSSA